LCVCKNINQSEPEGQMPAVKRVKLIITKGTNGNLAIMCLSTANGFHSGGGEWYQLTYLAGVNACD